MFNVLEARKFKIKVRVSLLHHHKAESEKVREGKKERGRESHGMITVELKALGLDRFVQPLCKLRSPICITILEFVIFHKFMHVTWLFSFLANSFIYLFNHSHTHKCVYVHSNKCAFFISHIVTDYRVWVQNVLGYRDTSLNLI